MNIFFLQTLYCSLDRSPYMSIKQNFLLFCLRNLSWKDQFRLLLYMQRFFLLNMLFLRNRQVMKCCVFIHNIGNCRIRTKKLREGLRTCTASHGVRSTRHYKFTIFGLHQPMDKSASYFESFSPTLHQMKVEISTRTYWLTTARELRY